MSNVDGGLANTTLRAGGPFKLALEVHIGFRVDCWPFYVFVGFPTRIEVVKTGLSCTITDTATYRLTASIYVWIRVICDVWVGWYR